MRWPTTERARHQGDADGGEHILVGLIGEMSRLTPRSEETVQEKLRFSA
jgi:hypothetical protein